MAAAMGRETDAVAFFAALAAAPYRFDFYQTLRRLECLHDDRPRWGRALCPSDEPIRLGQAPDLTFAPAPLAAFDASGCGAPPRLQVRLFGLLGPNGPLPIHITECARERLRQAGDPTLSRFLDVLHHRFLALFYRAWAQAQPYVNRDRPDDDRFTVYVGAFAGLAPDAVRGRDTIPDVAKLFHVGALMRPTRNAGGLAGIIRQFFGVSARIEQFVGHWMALEPADRTRLGPSVSPLGAGAVLGSRVWDRQHKCRVWLGPLTRGQYESFLPTGGQLQTLVDWMRTYLGLELEWDVRLTLERNQVPPLRLGSGPRLGWTTWLGTRPGDTDADDVCVRPESFV